MVELVVPRKWNISVDRREDGLAEMEYSETFTEKDIVEKWDSNCEYTDKEKVDITIDNTVFFLNNLEKIVSPELDFSHTHNMKSKAVRDGMTVKITFVGEFETICTYLSNEFSGVAKALEKPFDINVFLDYTKTFI